jgi:hypothetical protein
MSDLYEITELFRPMQKYFHLLLELLILNASFLDASLGEHMYSIDLEKFISSIYLKRSIDHLKM